MSKEEIMNDMKFIQVCDKYGVYWGNCDVYGELIVLNTPITDLFVIMDKNYNTIGVEYIDLDVEDLEEYLSNKYYGYCNFTDVLPCGDNLGYPFEEFTLKNIIDLSNQVEVRETNQDHSLRIKVNGVWVNSDWYDKNTIDNEDYFKLLSYIKFLGEEIKQYFLLSYHMQAMEFEMPDVYAYVRTLNDKLLEYVFNCASLSRRPTPSDYLSYIGQNIEKVDIVGISGLLSDAIDLLLTEEGYKIASENPNKVERINNRTIPDYPKLAKQLLRILDVTDEELKEKEENDRAVSLEKKIADFEPLLNEDIFK